MENYSAIFLGNLKILNSNSKLISKTFKFINLIFKCHVTDALAAWLIQKWIRLNRNRILVVPDDQVYALSLRPVGSTASNIRTTLLKLYLGQVFKYDDAAQQQGYYRIVYVVCENKNVCVDLSYV